MSRADRFEFTLDEETEKRLYELLTDMDTRKTDRFWIQDKRGYHAEYVKVRHGKWIYGNDFHWYTASCSACGYQRRTDIKATGWNQWKYCPNCGAKMDAEREEE